MTHTLNKEEQASLMDALRQPVVVKAIREALGLIQIEKSGAASLEAAAMAYNYSEGALGLVNKLYWMAEIKEVPVTTPKGFRKIVV